MKRTAAILIACVFFTGCAGAFAEKQPPEAQTAPETVFSESGPLENQETFTNECRISLDSTISVQGSGAWVENGRISITQGGVYIVSGSLPEGVIHVESAEPVKLILSGAEIRSAGTAVFSEGKRLIVESAPDTENFLYGGEDAALRTEGELLLCGEGSLSIIGADGIAADGGIQANGGSVSVSAEADAVKTAELAVRGGSAVLSGGLSFTSVSVSDGMLLALGSEEPSLLPETGCVRKTLTDASAGTEISVADEAGRTLLRAALPENAETAWFSDGTDCSGYKISAGA